MAESYSIFGPEKTPVDLTPDEAFEQGMRMDVYLKLEHGRLHNQRYARFKELVARKRAASVDNPTVPATREDIALLVATMYGHHSGYIMGIEDGKKAEAYAAALRNMGGTL
jgi:hypothetical protein